MSFEANQICNILLNLTPAHITHTELPSTSARITHIFTHVTHSCPCYSHLSMVTHACPCYPHGVAHPLPILPTYLVTHVTHTELPKMSAHPVRKPRVGWGPWRAVPPPPHWRWWCSGLGRSSWWSAAASPSPAWCGGDLAVLPARGVFVREGK